MHTSLTKASQEASTPPANDGRKTIKMAVINLMGFTERTDQEIAASCSHVPDGVDVEFEYFSPTQWIERSRANISAGNTRSKDTYRIENHGTISELAQRVHEFDGAVVSGAALGHKEFVQQSEAHPNGLEFYDELVTALNRLHETNTTTLLLCLSAQLDLERRHGVRREVAPNKLLDVFTLSVTNQKHPITSGIGSTVDMPVARFGYSIEEDIRNNPHIISLAYAEETGTALAQSGSFIYLTGHPEYSQTAIQDEFNRDFNKNRHRLEAAITRLGYGFQRIVEPTDMHREGLERGLQKITENFDRKLVTIGQPTRYNLKEPENTWGEDGRRIYANFMQHVVDQAEQGRIIELHPVEHATEELTAEALAR